MVVHEPPRRVLIPLPHSKVALSDYLYPGEGPSEALISLQELLGVKVNESAVQKDFEGQPGEHILLCELNFFFNWQKRCVLTVHL